MLTPEQLKHRLEGVFEERQAAVLSEVLVEAVLEGQRQLVKASDFNELKEIVRELGVKMGELAEAQRRTEQRVGELAEAQKRTEQRVEELAEAQRKTEEEVRELARQMGDAKAGLGGLARSVSYALENKAYRSLPGYLKSLGSSSRRDSSGKRSTGKR